MSKQDDQRIENALAELEDVIERLHQNTNKRELEKIGQELEEIGKKLQNNNNIVTKKTRRKKSPFKRPI